MFCLDVHVFSLLDQTNPFAYNYSFALHTGISYTYGMLDQGGGKSVKILKTKLL